MENIRVLLVDDHAVVRHGTRFLLNQDRTVEVVGEAARGEEACEQYDKLRPDVLVLDLSLPGIGGLAAIERIRARDAAAKIVVFTMHDEKIYLSRALQAGARGFVTKHTAGDHLLRAIHRVASGETYLDDQLVEKIALDHSSETSEDPLGQLTAREFDIFCLLARGYTTRQAAEELHLGYKTVANYATSIKSKLSADTAADLARIAYRRGLLENDAV